MTFPDKAYIAFCIEHRDELPEWEPRVGDFFINGDGEIDVMTEVFAGMFKYPGFAQRPPEWLWLPRPDQFWEMLEERGARGWSVVKTLEEGLYSCNCDLISPEWTEGPSPTIAC